MTIGYPGTPAPRGPMPYDRNPLGIFVSYDATLAPAASTIRYTYTVPAARRAILNSIVVLMRRATAAAPVAVFESLVGHTPSGGARNYIIDNPSTINTVDNERAYLISSQYLLGAGDTIEYFTFDSSTGGTVSFVSSLLATEFDV